MRGPLPLYYYCFLATLPSPIFWGFVFDKFCLKWDQRCSDAKGSCAIYDADPLRLWYFWDKKWISCKTCFRLHLLYGGMRTVALLADVYVLYHAKDLKLTEEEKEVLEEEPSGAVKINLHPADAVTDPLFPDCENI